MVLVKKCSSFWSSADVKSAPNDLVHSMPRHCEQALSTYVYIMISVPKNKITPELSLDVSEY